MYKQISIKNLKTFEDEQKLKIAPITLLYGENSSGKTTLLKALDIIHNIFLQRSIIDYAQIRVFSIYDRSPWRDSDLGIVDNMERAESWCEFYDPIFYDNW